MFLLVAMNIVGFAIIIKNTEIVKILLKDRYTLNYNEERNKITVIYYF